MASGSRPKFDATDDHREIIEGDFEDHNCLDIPYIDTHCHLDLVLEKYPQWELQQLSKFWERNFPSNCKACIHISCFLDGYPASKQLQSLPGVYTTYGIHPHEAKHYSDEVDASIRSMMKEESVVAWGECGLDYHYNNSEAEVQQEVFRRQLRGSVECDKPVVIHSRSAEEQTMQIMRECLPRDHHIHMHCWNNSWQMAETLTQEFPNLYVGVTGAVTFKKSEELKDVVSRVPLSKLLLETDAPYMAPQRLKPKLRGFRGMVAHPGHIMYIAAEIAAIKGVELRNVLQTCWSNSVKCYKLTLT
eukprot:GFYU01004341.1.p1 GENE.GFYU01004341.1~~GFYU01004341.1.p1  ORF type:complete len:328 (-),score=34.22 GFYU01004341.1:16-924(-)